MTCLHIVFLAFWQIRCMVSFVGDRARAPYAFVLPASLFPYSAWFLFAEHTSLFLFLECLLTLVQGSKFCPSTLPCALCGSASFKSIQAAADRGPVKFRFSFLTGPLSINLLTFVSPCHACVLCFYCFWHSYLPLPVLFSLPSFPHAPPPPFSPATPAHSPVITLHSMRFPAFPCCPFL